MKLVEKGADRQEMCKLIRRYSADSWKNVSEGNQNPLPALLKKDPNISSNLKPDEIDELLDPNKYIGDAQDRCRKLVSDYINPLLKKHKYTHLGKIDSEY
jgi:adenylosuccinate lyase